MWTTRLRYSGLGVLALALAGATALAWLQLNHAVFATLAGTVFFFGVLTVVARETWRQTSPANLESRGIYADERDLPVYDPGLRRNYQPMLPFGIGIGRQTSAPRVRSRPDRAARQAGQARPVGPVAMVAAAQARRGAGRQRSASLGPDATVNFGDERRASGIDEVWPPWTPS